MTDTPTLADAARNLPDDGKVSPADDDGMETYGAGWVRATVAGKVYRLRRPFMGEMRDLRIALEGLTDEITAHTEQSERARRRMIRTETRTRQELQRVQQAVLDGADDAPDEAAILALEDRLADQLAEARLADRESGRKLIQLADDNRARWWADVFSVLSVDGALPDQWPAWFADPNGPGTVLAHWRQNPLARG